MSDARSFEAPEDVVEEINALLEAEDWETLARHYDLSASDHDVETIASRGEDWFAWAGGPAVADPRGSPPPYHPFPPGSTYVGHELDGDLARVTVQLPDLAAALDEEGPDTRVFVLTRGEEGWRLVPPER